MGVSDRIELFIAELLKSDGDDGWVELRRNELASIFNCVPSQINYVIATRFTPERGYIVESKRGGGGYVRIRQAELSDAKEIFKLIGESIDYENAKKILTYLKNTGSISEETSRIVAAALSDNSICIQNPQRGIIRANILKNIINNLG